MFDLRPKCNKELLLTFDQFATILPSDLMGSRLLYLQIKHSGGERLVVLKELRASLRRYECV
jgi:hypothetical protein